MKHVFHLSIRRGSLIVDSEVIIQGESQSEVQAVVNATEEQVKTGTLGTFKTDPNYPLNVQISTIGITNGTTG